MSTCYSVVDYVDYDLTVYVGTSTSTLSGRTCMNWQQKIPHQHHFVPSDFGPTITTWGELSNFCRDPARRGQPWCFTTDPDVIFEYCDVPSCEESTTEASQVTDFPDYRTPSITLLTGTIGGALLLILLCVLVFLKCVKPLREKRKKGVLTAPIDLRHLADRRPAYPPHFRHPGPAHFHVPTPSPIPVPVPFSGPGQQGTPGLSRGFRPPPAVRQVDNQESSDEDDHEAIERQVNPASGPCLTSFMAERFEDTDSYQPDDNPFKVKATAQQLSSPEPPAPTSVSEEGIAYPQPVLVGGRDDGGVSGPKPAPFLSSASGANSGSKSGPKLTHILSSTVGGDGGGTLGPKLAPLLPPARSGGGSSGSSPKLASLLPPAGSGGSGSGLGPKLAPVLPSAGGGDSSDTPGLKLSPIKPSAGGGGGGGTKNVVAFSENKSVSHTFTSSTTQSPISGEGTSRSSEKSAFPDREGPSSSEFSFGSPRKFPSAVPATSNFDDSLVKASSPSPLTSLGQANWAQPKGSPPSMSKSGAFPGKASGSVSSEMKMPATNSATQPLGQGSPLLGSRKKADNAWTLPRPSPAGTPESGSILPKLTPPPSPQKSLSSLASFSQSSSTPRTVNSTPKLPTLVSSSQPAPLERATILTRPGAGAAARLAPQQSLSGGWPPPAAGPRDTKSLLTPRLGVQGGLGVSLGGGGSSFSALPALDASESQSGGLEGAGRRAWGQPLPPLGGGGEVDSPEERARGQEVDDLDFSDIL